MTAYEHPFVFCVGVLAFVWIALTNTKYAQRLEKWLLPKVAVSLGWLAIGVVYACWIALGLIVLLIVVWGLQAIGPAALFIGAMILGAGWVVAKALEGKR